MMDAIERYLRLRRSAGFALENDQYLLASFARFATERIETHIRTQTAIDWAAQGPSAAQRNTRLKVVCRFARHVRVEDDRHELPPTSYFSYRKKRRVPYIYTKEEINRLIEAAAQLRPLGALRPLATYLGHVNIYSTYWYLQAAPDLLQDIADIGESFMGGGAQS